MSAEASIGQPTQPAPSIDNDSVATQQHTEFATVGSKKGKGRLRRAFSFGSASELLKSSSQNSLGKREALIAERARREQLKEELGDEQAAIAVQQEASGLGESIYSHHSLLSGSTDNISISSTASSASIMLRKMGKGMKRSTRSLVGLFRPKSVIHESAPSSIVTEPMTPQLSVVNIEVDRKSPNVNANSLDISSTAALVDSQGPNYLKPGSFPERSGTDNSQMRKSIVGGDKERAEVLAAVRKGILKSEL